MSYEGYEQWLCANGHLYNYNCYDKPQKSTWKCPYCHAGVAFVGSVDQTNGAGKPQKFKIKKPAIECQCNSCGHNHFASPAEYEIPQHK